MYAIIDTHEVHLIEDFLDPVAFFGHLHTLVADERVIIGVGGYTPDERLRNWMATLPPLDIPREFDFTRRFERERRECPSARVVYFHATAQNLSALARLAKEIRNASAICDHVIGFRDEVGLISFHDAFHGDVMLLSTRIPGSDVEEFCRATSTVFRTVKNPQWGQGQE